MLLNLKTPLLAECKTDKDHNRYGSYMHKLDNDIYISMCWKSNTQYFPEKRVRNL